VSIHPTALVDSQAKLERDIEIGPYSIIGPRAVIGKKCVIGSHVVIEGDVQMDEHNVIGHGAIIGSAPQDLSFGFQTRSGVRIGSNNTIREHCTIHRGTAEGSMTTIGDKNFLMVGAHVGHNCTIGSNVIIANNCLLGGHVEIQDNAFLGGGCVFHQFIRVGRLAITQGGSAFSADIPPFIMAALLNYAIGLNAVGLKRGGFTRQQRDELKAAFKLVYTSGLNTSQALERAAEKNWGAVAREFFDFIAAAKKRGICAYRGRSEGRASARPGSAEVQPSD
jgi:UDP-N-acetylglucosamine acyltransferase